MNYVLLIDIMHIGALIPFLQDDYLNCLNEIKIIIIISLFVGYVVIRNSHWLFIPFSVSIELTTIWLYMPDFWIGQDIEHLLFSIKFNNL